MNYAAFQTILQYVVGGNNPAFIEFKEVPVHKTYISPDVHKPLAGYCHAVEVPSTARFLFLAGIGGRRPDGERPEGIDAQADQCWRNILNVLKTGGMAAEDVVRVTTYVTNVSYRDATGAARRRAIGDVLPASTFLVVAALASPDMLIEIDVMAAKA